MVVPSGAPTPQEEEGVAQAAKSAPGFDQEAPFYDLARGHLVDDIGLYATLLAPPPKSVLVPMCGTGRIVFGLLKAGHNVEGIDSSGTMITAAQAKRAGLTPDELKRIMFVQEDVIYYRADTPFDAVVLGGNSLPLLLRRTDRHHALLSLRAALRPGGLLVVQIDTPASLRGLAEATPRMASFRPVDTDGSIYVRFIAGNPVGHHFVRHVVFNTILSPTRGPVRSAYTHVYYRVLSSQELQEEVREAGFQVKMLLGDYRGNPYHEGSPFIILVAEAQGVAPPAPATTTAAVPSAEAAAPQGAPVLSFEDLGKM